MKKSSIILAIAAVLLGLMYWAKPKPTSAPTLTQSPSKSNQAPTRVKERSAIARKKPPNVRGTNHVSHVHLVGRTNSLLPILPESVPAHLRVLLGQQRRLPWPDLVAKLSPDDQQVLMQLYFQSTNVLVRNSLTMALGLIGDEEVVALFKNALTQEPVGKTLPSGYPSKADEENALCNTVVAMGFLAAKYDSAYDFIKQGADLKFWRDQVQWVSSPGRDTVGMLTSYSIQAIGQSGRPDVPQLLEQFKTNDKLSWGGGEDPTTRKFAGDVVQAAFFYDLIQQSGMDALRSNIFTENIMTLFLQWRETDSGKKWRAWRTAADRKK